MSRINFLYTEQVLTKKDIENFEAEFKVLLPSNLKSLLLKFNGGVLDGEIKNYAFSILRPIKYGINTLEVAIDDLQLTEQHIPREEIPFANDQGGNVFTISTREEDYGKIYFWALDVGEPRREFAANSLEEFFGIDSFE